MWTKEQRDEIYRQALAACRPKAPPPNPTPAVKARERFAASNQRTGAIIDAATRGNEALAQRLEETMEDRRRKRIAKGARRVQRRRPRLAQAC